MANTIELHRTTYNALIVEQWVREGNREETMRCFIYIYFLKKNRIAKCSIGRERETFVRDSVLNDFQRWRSLPGDGSLFFSFRNA